jgi:hypothetical protein
MKLPVGWSVEDSITYSGIYNGIFIYSDLLADSMDAIDGSDSYSSWWVFVGDTVDTLLDGMISFNPRLHTDDQTGTLFFIDYVFGDNGNGLTYRRSDAHPLSVNAPMEVTVTNTNNDGEGSLRKALFDININGKITFDLSYPDTIRLNNQLVINRNVTLSGPGSENLTISGRDSNRVIEINGNLTINISNLNISNGNALGHEGGGAILCGKSELNLTNVTIMNNYGEYAGGINAWRSILNFSNVIITKNIANKNGGGIICSVSEINFSDVKITKNIAGLDGGGMVSNENNGILKNVIISENIASDQGGGLALRGHNDENLNLTNVTVSKNGLYEDGHFSGWGGGIYMNDVSPVLKYVTISENGSAGGGGIYMGGASPLLLNVLITDNKNVGIDYEGYNNAIFVNCILWNDRTPEIEIRNAGNYITPITIAYSNLQGGFNEGIRWDAPDSLYSFNWLEGNIDTNPLFRDASNGDFTLQSGSPCINAGIAFFEYDNNVLLNLHPWQYNGSAPDMGSYEAGPALDIIEVPPRPIRYSLKQNYPNPFNPITTIDFYLPQSSEVTVKIFNILGEEVLTLVSDRLNAGRYNYQWDASDMPSGLYLYRLEVEEFVEIKKMLLVR